MRLLANLAPWSWKEDSGEFSWNCLSNTAFTLSLAFGIRTNSKSINETSPIKEGHHAWHQNHHFSKSRFPWISDECTPVLWRGLPKWQRSGWGPRTRPMSISQFVESWLKTMLITFGPLQKCMCKKPTKKRTNPWILFKVVPENEHQLESFSNWVFSRKSRVDSTKNCKDHPG